MSYLPGLLSNGVLAPGLTPAAVRSTLDVPSNQDLTDAIDAVDLSGHLPLSGGTVTGNLRAGTLRSGIIGNEASICFLGGQNGFDGFARLDNKGLTAKTGFHFAPDAQMSSVDLSFYRDGPGQLAQRDGLNPQALHIYNTYTSDTDYERGFVGFTSNRFEVRPEVAGSGATRPSYFGSTSAASITYVRGQGVEYFFGSDGIRPPAAAGNRDLGGPIWPWRNIFLRPSSSLTPSSNGDLCIEATNNTTITLKLKGSDGTVRSGTVSLS